MKWIVSHIIFFYCFFVSGQEMITFESDSLRIEIQRLPESVNSPYNDYAPVVTADGSEMYFTSRRPVTEKEIKKGMESREMIYVSYYSDSVSGWSNAKALPENVNIPGRFVSNISISSDGQRLLIYQDDRYGNGDIYESLLKGENWSDMTAYSRLINSDYHESSACYSPDGRTLYYVSERLGGNGKRDIWKCTRDNKGGWRAPENLGSIVNTPEDEESVFIHPDGVTLYFSSRGHNSIGGFDVFKSVLKDGNWSKPVSLGEPINTTGDDLFFVLTASGEKGYYASSRDADQKDIYEIRFYPLIHSVEEEQPKLTVLKGTIRDEKTQNPIEAKIEIIDNERNEIVGEFNSNSESGKYLIPLPAGKNYGISVTASGYLFHSENVDIPDTARFQEIIRDIDLKKLEIGTQIVLRNIFFELDKYSLKTESVAELDRLYKLMIDNPEMKIELSGHTDTQGSAEHNKELSENRATAVVNYLCGLGIDNDRFVAVGYGEEKPIIFDREINKMETEKARKDAHAFNRRTEIRILGF